MKLFFFLGAFFVSILGFGKQTLEERIDLSGEPKAGYLHLPRERAIDQSTFLYIKYALEAFRKEQVRFVLLELNTPGGEVFAALRITEELKKMESEFHIPVIAFVDNWALSAGALLAYSCPFIGAVSDASMGAAEPVMVGSDGKMETASEKMISALRTEFAKAARLYGRNPLVAEAMVDKDVVLVLRKGEVIQLLENGERVEGDTLINGKGKLLTLDAQKMAELGVSDFTVPKKLIEDPFFREAKIRFISYENWKIRFFAFLSHPIVSSVLMFGLMIGLYSLIREGGLTSSSLIGLVCFSLIIVSSFSTEIIGFLEVFLLSLGLVFFLIDVFMLGGFGFFGGLGLFLFLFGITAMTLPPLQGFSWNPVDWGIQMSEWSYRLTLFLLALFLFFALFLPFSGFFLRKSSAFKRLILRDQEEGLDPLKNLPEIGETGVCLSSLRPFGKVEIGGIMFEAKSEGEFFSSGANVEVMGYIGNILRVREKKQ